MAVSAKTQRELNSQIDTLLFKRDNCYQQVDTLYTLALSLTVESTDLEMFQCRIEKLECNYSTFNKCNAEIVKFRSILNSDSKNNDLAEIKSLTTDMDTRYFYLLSAFKRFCPDVTLAGPALRSNESFKQPQDAVVRLPPIEIPHFDRVLKGWPAFKD